MEFNKDAWFMQDIESIVTTKVKNGEQFEVVLAPVQRIQELASKNQHVVDARGMVHHQWRPPEAVDDLSSYDAKVESTQEFPSELETDQVVSFLALKFECYDFDYGGNGKTTCIWIDHRLNELPQLIILSEILIEYESCLARACFFVFKDEFARFRSMTFAMMLLHNLRNHVKPCAHVAYLSRVKFRKLVCNLV